jgi:hypothetical protein
MTPNRLLGGTKGTLIVDAYSGYNVVADVSKRKRAACHAHLRRYFDEALPTAPIAQQAIDLILGIYRIEHDAKEQQCADRCVPGRQHDRAHPIVAVASISVPLPRACVSLVERFSYATTCAGSVSRRGMCLFFTELAATIVHG